MSTTRAAAGDAFGIAGVFNGPVETMDQLVDRRIDAGARESYAVVDFVGLLEAIHAMARAINLRRLKFP